MSTLLVQVREPLNIASSAETLARAICPYLETFGGTAKLVSVDQYRVIRGGRERERVSALRVALSGSQRADLVTIAGWLEGFLKPTAKQAQLTARFDVLVGETSGHAEDDRRVGTTPAKPGT